MELNTSFLSGFGCGLCVGITFFTYRKYYRNFTRLANAKKEYTSRGEYKLALVVRSDLNMTKGKIAAQCGHASVDAFDQMRKKDPTGLACWMLTEQTKVAVKANSLEDLEQIADNAKEIGIIVSFVRDEGRTQVAANTVTVLGVGPAPRDKIDKVTGHLKLL